jgi:hypothetical protein
MLYGENHQERGDEMLGSSLALETERDSEIAIMLDL